MGLILPRGRTDKKGMEALSLTAYETTALLFGIILVRYFAVSGAFYFVCCVLKRSEWQHKRIQAEFPRRKQIAQEIGWSVISCLIFAVSGTVGQVAWQKGFTRIYLDVSDYGVTYLLLSVPLLMFLHDTYFYFAHRLMHHRVLFERVHKVHHLSRNPSPWASFSFHPFEAVLEALILPLLILFVPVHPLALLVFVTIMTIFGVVNHTGYELYPMAFIKHRWLRAWLTTTHHQMHHKYYRTNYGLYFTLWDRWLGTEHAGYETFFAQVKNQAPARTKASRPETNLRWRWEPPRLPPPI